MRKLIAVAGMVALFVSAVPGSFAKTPVAQKSAAGSIVIVFKDGHKQSFNLADVARIEFAGGGDAAFVGGVPMNQQTPARGQFVGRWVVGVGTGGDDTFTITLKDDGNAMRSLRSVHGTWAYVNGEARITWDDGAQDAIRKAGSRFEKYAYRAGKSFTDTPDNVTPAENTTPKPI